MDPSLKEKQAFFEQLDACRECGDESDVLSTEEQFLRQKCKAFFSLAGAAPVSLPSPSKPKLLGSRPRRTASDPIPKPTNAELEIIAATPRDNSLGLTASASVDNASTSDSLIPEPEQHLDERIARGSAHPTARVLRSQSDLEPSPSSSMAKRKRTELLQMAPESKQIFKGLCFFYIPNDDINPARRIRITKAREHGAIWTRESKVATHVIVDSNLKYSDIKPILDRNPISPSVVLVNDRYPVDCWIKGVVFDPKMHKYKVEEDPTPTKKQTAPQASTREPGSSLQIKQRRDARPVATSAPQSPQGSGDLVPSSYPEVIQSPKSTEATNGTGLHLKSRPCDATETPIFADELAKCIDAVLDDPEKHEYLDDENDQDARVSENEGPPKKKGKGHLRPQRNDANVNFSQDKFMCMRGGTRDS